MLLAFKIGILLGLSIIITIGAQNLFVIQQAVRNEHTYLAALTCFFCDFIMIIIGAAGVSIIFIEFPTIKSIVLILGIMFLMKYGYDSIQRGLSGNASPVNMNSVKLSVTTRRSFSRIILLSLTFSLLNPAAILDAIVIIGGSANQYNGAEKIYFLIGSISASLIWFLILATTTKFLAKKIASNIVWRTLDFISGGLMLGIALKFGYQLTG